eukprot:TRINITY_DN2771_c0_g1_i2.p1 TRINITY_DN2771_c0_g1~~TRINITY_DN2771_c0_g1_i2.p1  ORF type:complete len:287 (+),score=50.51 TRINITY_DN2771_c0_g1_i2:371-1231(+)
MPPSTYHRPPLPPNAQNRHHSPSVTGLSPTIQQTTSYPPHDPVPILTMFSKSLSSIPSAISQTFENLTEVSHKATSKITSSMSQLLVTRSNQSHTMSSDIPFTLPKHSSTSLPSVHHPPSDYPPPTSRVHLTCAPSIPSVHPARMHVIRGPSVSVAPPSDEPSHPPAQHVHITCAPTTHLNSSPSSDVPPPPTVVHTKCVSPIQSPSTTRAGTPLPIQAPSSPTDTPPNTVISLSTTTGSGKGGGQLPLPRIASGATFLSSTTSTTQGSNDFDTVDEVEDITEQIL